MPEAAEKLYYRIGEVEQITEVPAYVLRYWESEFKLLRPKKNLLYGERLTLEGAKKRLLAESRKSGQLDLGLREVSYGEALKRIRDRLTALRSRLTP